MGDDCIYSSYAYIVLQNDPIGTDIGQWPVGWNIYNTNFPVTGELSGGIRNNGLTSINGDNPATWKSNVYNIFYAAFRFFYIIIFAMPENILQTI